VVRVVPDVLVQDRRDKKAGKRLLRKGESARIRALNAAGSRVYPPTRLEPSLFGDVGRGVGLPVILQRHGFDRAQIETLEERRTIVVRPNDLDVPSASLIGATELDLGCRLSGLFSAVWKRPDQACRR
jgi:hypothetical protein